MFYLGYFSRKFVAKIAQSGLSDQSDQFLSLIGISLFPDLRMFNQLWGNLVYTPEEEQESSSEESQPQEDIEYLYLLLEACDENMFQRLEKIIRADIDVTTVKHKLWVVLTLKDISEGLRYLHSKGLLYFCNYFVYGLYQVLQCEVVPFLQLK